MKLRIMYTVDVDEEIIPALVAYAKIGGYDYDKPTVRELLKRLYRDEGLTAEVRAADAVRNKEKDDE